MSISDKSFYIIQKKRIFAACKIGHGKIMNTQNSRQIKTSLRVLLSVVCVLCGLSAQAQDPHMSQYFAHPLFLNPAFAGANDCPRFALGYRNQWPNIAGGFSTISASYDQHIHAIRGGLGAKVFADIQGGGTYRNMSAALTYSYRFKLGRNFSLRLAAEAAYVNRYANWHGLTFPDQFDPMLGLVRPSTDEDLTNTPINRHYADFAVGALGYNRYFYVGVSVNHLTRPDEGFMSVQRLPMKYTFQAGGLIYLRKTYGTKHREKDLTLSPNLVFTQQGKFEELSYGLYANIYPMVVGLWYRHNFTNSDALVALLGFEYKGVRIAYNYDVSLSKLRKSGGSHEVSLGFRLPCPDLNKPVKIQAVPCPAF